MEIILIIALVIIGGIAFAASRKPDQFSVSRSAVYSAAAAEIFPHVNDLVKWQAWSPWARLDPQAKTTFTGPSAGVGARFAWESKKIGAGEMTVIESTPSSQVRMKLEFFRPMKGVNDVLFSLAPETSGTRLTWTMSGKSSFNAKVIGLFINCDKMVATQFDSGLANLKVIVDKP